jgi:hypothetical protein
MIPPLSDTQWQLFRNKMEEVAEGNTRSGVKLNPIEVAEALLILMDRIDELEKRLRDQGAA